MSNIKLGRRDLLRGLGAGAVLLSPFVRSATAYAAPGSPPNLLIFHTPNGHLRSAFGGTGAGADFKLLPSLAPLEPYKSQVSVLRNINNPGASTKHSHEDIVRLLTCLPGGDIYRGYGPSIDWVVAKSFGQRPMTLSSMWSAAPNWQTKLSWKEDNAFDPHVDSAQAAYADVFGGFVAPSTGGVDVARLGAQNKSVLDFVMQDIATLNGRLSAQEKIKLGNHLEALRQLEKSVSGGLTCSTDGLKAAVDAMPAGGSRTEALQRAIELKVDLMTTAFACGVRRVGTLLCQGGSAGINPISGGGDHHPLSHAAFDDKNAGAIETIKKVDAWYAARFAYVLKRLTDLDLLQNTVVVWTSEIAEQHVQTGHVIPIAGGGGLGMKHGRVYEGGLLSNVWVSVQNAMNIDKSAFGAQSSGGIPGLHT